MSHDVLECVVTSGYVRMTEDFDGYERVRRYTCPHLKSASVRRTEAVTLPEVPRYERQNFVAEAKIMRVRPPKPPKPSCAVCQRPMNYPSRGVLRDGQPAHATCRPNLPPERCVLCHEPMHRRYRFKDLTRQAHMDCRAKEWRSRLVVDWNAGVPMATLVTRYRKSRHNLVSVLTKLRRAGMDVTYRKGRGRGRAPNAAITQAFQRAMAGIKS